MAPNIYCCCGAGTAADTEAVTGALQFHLYNLEQRLRVMLLYATL